jgi:hypothetical protein
MDIDDEWVEKMGDKIAVDISFNNSYEIFEVKTLDDKFIIHPNIPTNLRFKFSYRFISFGIQFAPDFIPGNEEEDLKGKTKSFGLGTQLIFRHSFFDISYTNITGFYLQNSNDYISRASADPYIQFPDLNYKGFSFSSGYSSNENFSLRSLSSQTERQLKSIGSFMPVFNFRYFTIDDKSNGGSTQKSNNIETSIGPGYAYTFVVKTKFYFSLGLLANVGYLHTKLTTRLPEEDIITNQNNFIFRWDGKTGIGYNGRRFYSGLYANVSGTKYNQENTTVVNFETRIFYHLFFGIRLNAPSELERQFDKIQRKFP